MLWDASQAYGVFYKFAPEMYRNSLSAANDRYDLAIKNALVAAGSTGFTYPPCDAQAYTSGSDYSGGTNVSYDGYVYIFAADVGSRTSSVLHLLFPIAEEGPLRPRLPRRGAIGICAIVQLPIIRILRARIHLLICICLVTPQVHLGGSLPY